MTGPSGSKPRILVVEDEAITREAAVEMLEEAGFEVLEAGNGTEAIRVLDGVDGIRVVMTDIDMPAGLDGIRLAACIDRRWPGIGVVVVSGKVRPAPGDVPARGHFFRKPYEAEAVTRVIRRLAGA
jgi:two-component system, response regulator PdtaR